MVTKNESRFYISNTISGLIYNFLTIDPDAYFEVQYESGVINFKGVANTCAPDEEEEKNNGNSL